MNKTELLIRQQMLVQKSGLLRERLEDQSDVLVKPLWLMDQGRLGLRWLSDHPIWPAAALVLVTLLKPRRTLAWGQRIWSGWKTYRTVKAWLLKNRHNLAKTDL
jgi:hypothetical protein